MMNSTIIIRIIFLIILCLSLETTPIFALDKNLLQTVYTWSSTEYVQGTNGSVNISIVSSAHELIEISWFGLRFSWMEPDYYYQKDYGASGNLILIDAVSIGIFNFNVPSSAKTGANTVEVKLNYLVYSAYGSFTNSLTYSTSIIVVDVFRGSYSTMLRDINLELVSAKNANYSSPLALSYVQSAENEYTMAQTFASSWLHFEATAHLTLAQNALSQAKATETEYKKNQEVILYQETVLRNEISTQKETIAQQTETISQQIELIKQLQQTTFIISGLLVVAILGITVVYFVFNKKLKQAREAQSV